MAVNTAGQSARPRPNANVAQHPSENFRYGEPQAGGDRGGPRHLPASGGIDTSGGRAKPGAPYATDHARDQGGKKLYLGKAFENAQRVSFVKVKGNSMGKAETLKNHESDTIKKAAKTRITKGNKVDSQVKGHDEYAGLKFRPELHPYGPPRPERRTEARDHNEHQSTRRF